MPSDQVDQAAGVGDIAIVQQQAGAVLLVGVVIDVIDAGGVEGAGAADEPMDLVALV